MEIYQIYMVVFLLIYFGLVIGIRSMMLYHKTKIDPIKDFGKKPTVRRAERIIQVSLILMIVIAINFILIPKNYLYLLPINALAIGWIQTTGFVLSMIGLVFAFVAQLQMKDSWRLGIDKNDDVDLITTGLFSISRNPIYLGLGLGFIGFFFIAPNVFSILFLVLMFYGVNEKIKDEETFLLSKFGSSFSSYKSKVGKWF